MAESSRYLVPAKECRDEQIIRRSRFATTIARADSIEAARAVIDKLHEEHRAATHNCWAYVIGPPGSMAHNGMSDDGEVRGTAGRPMLEILLHSGVGDVVAVVSRTYGGTKLGTGGLVRAYSGGVKGALARLERTEKVTLTTLRLRLDYPMMSHFEHLAEQWGVTATHIDWREDITITAEVAEDRREAFLAELLEVCGGAVAVLPEEDSPTVPGQPESTAKEPPKGVCDG